jgi:hypothetical protein
LRMSEVFLGLGATLGKNPTAGESVDGEWLMSVDVPGILMRHAGPRTLAGNHIQRTWRRIGRGTSEDGGKLDAAFVYASTHPSYRQPPFWFWLWDTDVATVEYNAWISPPQRQHQFEKRYDYTVQWAELIRSVAS